MLVSKSRKKSKLFREYIGERSFQAENQISVETYQYYEIGLSENVESGMYYGKSNKGERMKCTFKT